MKRFSERDAADAKITTHAEAAEGAEKRARSRDAEIEEAQLKVARAVAEMQRAVHAEELARAAAGRAAATAEAQLESVRENHSAERAGQQGEIEQLSTSLRAAEADAERARADEMRAAAELDQLRRAIGHLTTVAARTEKPL